MKLKFVSNFTISNKNLFTYRFDQKEPGDFFY